MGDCVWAQLINETGYEAQQSPFLICFMVFFFVTVFSLDHAKQQ